MASRASALAALLLAVVLLCVAASARVTERPGRLYRWDYVSPSFGDWCDETADCMEVDENLECRNRICQCRWGFRYKNGVCIEYIRSPLLTTPRAPRLGDWCDISADCAQVGRHMLCSNGVCVCTAGHVLLHGECKKRTRPAPNTPTRFPQPGDRCEETDDCAVADINLECENGICRCKEAHFMVDGMCKKNTVYGLMSTVRPPKLGDWCDEKEDCTLLDGNLECRFGVCRCREEHALVNGLCQKEIITTTMSTPRSPQPGDLCEETDDCAIGDENLECVDGVCQCNEGSVLVAGLCMKNLIPKVGDMCEEKEDCAVVDVNLICKDARCECKEGHILDGNLCKASAVEPVMPFGPMGFDLGKWCTMDEDCTKGDRNLECFGGLCLCKQDYFPYDGHCVKDTESAEMATLPPSMPPAQSTRPTSPPVPTTPRTLPSSLPTLLPTRTTTSSIGTSPTPQTSPPSPLTTMLAMPMHTTPPPPTPPLFPSTTPPPPSPLLTTPPPATTKPPPPTASPTLRSQTSTPSRPSRPSRRPSLGEPCFDSDECALTDRNMECFSSVCLCKSGYSQRDALCKKEILSTGDDFWTWGKTNPAKIGALCEETSDCPVEEKMECRRGYCQCIQGYADDSDTCKRKINILNGSCNAVTDVCHLGESDGNGNTECVNGKCSCKQGFVPNDGRCRK